MESKNDGFFSGISTVDVDLPKRMQVLNIDGTPMRYPNEDGSFTDAYIDVYSTDSAAHQAHQDAVSKRRFDASNRGQRYKATPENQRAEQTDIFVAITAGWLFRRANGEEIPFTSENARRFYESRELKYIRDQVDEFAANRTNFAKP